MMILVAFGKFTRTFAVAVLVMAGGCGLFTREERSKPGDLIVNLGNDVEMRFVLIEEMKLQVGRYEVTNLQYRKFKPEHDSGRHKDLPLNQDKQPVVNVSWSEAVKFCEWLTDKHGNVGGRQYVFRLPTEKEWIQFATAGQYTEYPWGNDWPPPDGWNYFGQENPAVGPKIDRSDKFRVAAPVRRSGRNEWGIYGVGGNVWEWVADKDGKNRVMKGASWSDSAPLFLHTERRSMYPTDYRYINLGFRVVAEPVGAGADEKPVPEQAPADDT